MGKMIEQIWIRKTSKFLSTQSATVRFGPGPQITIPARGLLRRPHCKA